MDKSKEERIAELEKNIKFYESKLNRTLDQADRCKWDGKIDAAKKEINQLKEKKLTPKVKRRIEDPVIAEKKTQINENDGRGSVINIGGGTYSIKL